MSLAFRPSGGLRFLKGTHRAAGNARKADSHLAVLFELPRRVVVSPVTRGVCKPRH